MTIPHTPHTADQLKEIVNQDLDTKLIWTRRLIHEWHNKFASKVYVAFSGGKDSTVLLHLVRSLYPEVIGVFSNTGLEYPEILKFVKSHSNIKVVAPVKKFPQVLKEDGFPITNKKQARTIARLQNPTEASFRYRRLCLMGYVSSKGIFNRRSRVSDKWMHLVFSDLKVTAACCDYLKKDPMSAWEKKNTKMRAFVGTMMGEGPSRDYDLNHRACNAFDASKPSSVPLKFWTDKDVYEYADRFNVEICSVYKDLNLSRTGCTFCAYGAEQEPKNNNRFTNLKKSHPVQFNIFVNKLGMNKALDYAGINYGEEPLHKAPGMPEYICKGCGESFSMIRIGFITDRKWTELEKLTRPVLAGMNLWCGPCCDTHIPRLPRNPETMTKGEKPYVSFI